VEIPLVRRLGNAGAVANAGRGVARRRADDQLVAELVAALDARPSAGRTAPPAAPTAA
jgi:hypothetical protein